jgi:hypothetical protein
MANIKISAMTPVSALAAADIFPVVQGGVNKRATVSNLIAGSTDEVLKKNAAGTLEATGCFSTSAGVLGVGTNSPDRTFHIEVDNATNNNITYVQRLTHTTSGTPSVAICVGTEFEVETAAGNNEVGGTIEVITTDVTAASEDFDCVIRLMAGGAAATQRFRISSADHVTIGTSWRMMPRNSGFFAGLNSGNLTQSGTNNIGTGDVTFNALTSGASNVAYGRGAGSALTSGFHNIFIGHHAGDNLITGSNCVAIGANIELPSTATNGQLTIQNIIFGTGNTATATTISTGSVGVGVASPARRFHVSQDTVNTNVVTYVNRLTLTTSGTPANGIGVGVEFETETSAGNNEVGATIEAVVTDVTSTSEDFDLVFKTMAAGAAASEKVRIQSAGNLYVGTAALATTAVAGFLHIPTCAGPPTGVPTLVTGLTPMVYDSTNNFLYFYVGGAWKKSTVYA